MSASRRPGRCHSRPKAAPSSRAGRIAPVSTVAGLAERFAAPFELTLRIIDVPIHVATNDAGVHARLQTYFAPYVLPLDTGASASVAVVRLIQGALDPGGAFCDVPRAPGRKVKEAIQERPDGRLIWKRETGVIMGLWPGHALAVGDLRAHLNQAINLVCASYAKVVLGRGHLLLHASAVSRGGRAVALGGAPGAGKSTAALRLVEAGSQFVSNDRALVRPDATGAEILGYPKQPRVNPGTLLHHPRLWSLLSAEDRTALASLPPGELWALERKADVDLGTLYGPAAVSLRGRLGALVILKWRPESGRPVLRRLDAAAALAEVPLVYKDLGVFDLDRPPRVGPTAADLSRYAELFAKVGVTEVTGGVDFGLLVDAVRDLQSS
jgi:HprK-related kinase B